MITRLRPARPRDDVAMARILADWADATHWVPAVHSVDAHRDHAAQLIETATVTVVARLGRPVGFLARRGGFVHALYLDSASRGRGLGTRLIARAKAETDCLTLWTHEANAEARSFYARHGFAEVERGDGSNNDEGLPEVRLEWRRSA